MGRNGKPKSCFELFAVTQDRHRPGGGTVARLTSKEAWTDWEPILRGSASRRREEQNDL